MKCFYNGSPNIKNRKLFTSILGDSVTVTSPECYGAFKITDSCGISASSAMTDDTLPGNVITDDDTFWAPAIRYK